MNNGRKHQPTDSSKANGQNEYTIKVNIGPEKSTSVKRKRRIQYQAEGKFGL